MNITLKQAKEYLADNKITMIQYLNIESNVKVRENPEDYKKASRSYISNGEGNRYSIDEIETVVLARIETIFGTITQEESDKKITDLLGEDNFEAIYNKPSTDMLEDFIVKGINGNSRGYPQIWINSTEEILNQLGKVQEIKNLAKSIEGLRKRYGVAGITEDWLSQKNYELGA